MTLWEMGKMGKETNLLFYTFLIIFETGIILLSI